MKKYVFVMIFCISIFIGLRFNNSYHSEIKVVDDNNGQCWPDPTEGQNRWFGCCRNTSTGETSFFSEDNDDYHCSATSGCCPSGWEQLSNLSDCCDNCDPDEDESPACYVATINGSEIYRWGKYRAITSFSKVSDVTSQEQCNSLTIKKVDSQNKNTLLSGAEISITGPNNYSRNATIGSITLNKLVPGNYTIVETVAPTGYVKNNTSIGFRVLDDGTILVIGESVSATNNLTISIKNTKMEETIFCWKKTGTNGNEYQESVTSPGTGWTKVGEAGTVTCSETPACYKNGDTYKYGNYNGVSGYTKVAGISSSDECNNFCWKKTGTNGNEYQENITSPGTGWTKVGKVGSVTCSETPACYKILTAPGGIVEYVWGKFGGNSNYTLVANTPESQCNVLTIFKVDENGSFKTGAKITITGPNNFNETKSIGFGVTISKLSTGTYKIKETVAPTDYKLDQTEIKVTVSSTGTITITNASNLYDRSTSATRSAYLSIKNVKKEACYYNKSTGEYDWTNSPKTGYEELKDVSEEYCKDVCYYNTNTKEYVWQRKSEVTIPELVEIDKINSKDKCKPFCYYSSKDDDYKWDALPPSDDYKVVESIDVETNCVKNEVEACYKNKSTGKHVWGKYENDSSYTFVDGVDKEDCNDVITDVPKTDFDVSTIIYIAIAILLAAGIGFIIYSNYYKKND